VRALSAIVTEYQPERLELVGKASGATRRNGNGNGNGNGHRTRYTNGNGASRRRLNRRATIVADLGGPATPVPTPQSLVPDPLQTPPGDAMAGGGSAT